MDSTGTIEISNTLEATNRHPRSFAQAICCIHKGTSLQSSNTFQGLWNWFSHKYENQKQEGIYGWKTRIDQSFIL